MRRLTPRLAEFEHVAIEPDSSFRLAHSRNGRGYDLHLHYHPEMELTLIVRGRGMRFVGDSVQPFEEGDLCLLGADLLHTWYTGDAPQRTEAIVVQFAPGFLNGLGERWPELRHLPELCERSRRGLAYSGRTRSAAADLMMRASAAPAASIQRFAILLQAFERLIHCTDPDAISTSSPLHAQPNHTLLRFRRVMGVLHQQMPAAPEQSEMARLSEMTPAGFSRFFRRMVGRSYVDYINAWRISLACRQLLQTTLPVTRIAFDCGFTNLSNFNRRFMQYKQTTPTRYRELARSV